MFSISTICREQKEIEHMLALTDAFSIKRKECKAEQYQVCSEYITDAYVIFACGHSIERVLSTCGCTFPYSHTHIFEPKITTVGHFI